MIDPGDRGTRSASAAWPGFRHTTMPTFNEPMRRLCSIATEAASRASTTSIGGPRTSCETPFRRANDNLGNGPRKATAPAQQRPGLRSESHLARPIVL